MPEGRESPSFRAGEDVNTLFNEEEKLAHAGEKTVRQAMDAAHQQITPLLKEPF